MALTNLRTLGARLANKITGRNDPVAAKLIRLKTAAETDYDVVIQKAEQAHTAVRGEIGTAAAAEVDNIRASLESAARRAEALRPLGVTLLSAHGDEKVQAIAAAARQAAQA
jgi:hypothetical protein